MLGGLSQKLAGGLGIFSLAKDSIDCYYTLTLVFLYG